VSTSVDQRPASAGLDHERLRAAAVDLPRLLHIADQARGFYGPIDCVEGGCEHGDGPDRCPLLEVRYATADDLERLDHVTALLRRVGELARQGLIANPAAGLDLLQQIADLAGDGVAHNAGEGVAHSRERAMNHYRVESGSDDTGRVRPADDNHHEFEAPDDDEAVRVATAYAFSQHGPNTRSRLYRRSFLGWVPVSEVVIPCPARGADRRARS
jgi:hypothetical protein